MASRNLRNNKRVLKMRLHHGHSLFLNSQLQWVAGMREWRLSATLQLLFEHNLNSFVCRGRNIELNWTEGDKTTTVLFLFSIFIIIISSAFIVNRAHANGTRLCDAMWLYL